MAPTFGRADEGFLFSQALLSGHLKIKTSSFSFVLEKAMTDKNPKLKVPTVNIKTLVLITITISSILIGLNKTPFSTNSLAKLLVDSYSSFLAKL